MESEGDGTPADGLPAIARPSAWSGRAAGLCRSWTTGPGRAPAFGNPFPGTVRNRLSYMMLNQSPVPRGGAVNPGFGRPPREKTPISA